MRPSSRSTTFFAFCKAIRYRMPRKNVQTYNGMFFVLTTFFTHRAFIVTSLEIHEVPTTN